VEQPQNVASSFPSERKVRARRLRRASIFALHREFGLASDFLGGELRQRATHTNAWSLPPRWIIPRARQGKLGLPQPLMQLFFPPLFHFQPCRIFASFWTWLNQSRDGSPYTSLATDLIERVYKFIGTIFSQGRAVSKSELDGLFKLSGVASGDDALTLGLVNAEHLRLEPFSPFSKQSYLGRHYCCRNGKLEKDFMLGHLG
jgi:hypothetical protein